jgi:hypothetical protein
MNKILQRNNIFKDETLTAVKMSILVFQVVEAVWTSDRYQHFAFTYCFHLGPEDGGSMFLRNVGIYLQVYQVLQPRSRKSTTYSEFLYNIQTMKKIVVLETYKYNFYKNKNPISLTCEKPQGLLENGDKRRGERSLRKEEETVQ